ncbi:MAG: ABC transporter substrate-binding protein [Eubacteriales bacterium]
MSDKKDSTELLQDNDFEKVFTNTMDVEAIDRKIKKQKRQIQIGIFAILLAVFGFYQYQQYLLESNQDYLGGNVIRLANGSSQQEEVLIPSPWRNASYISSLLFRTLFLTDNSYTEINPNLAEKFVVQDEGLTYVITLRDDQKWSDGMPITTEDVLFSFEAFMSCTNVNSYVSAAFNKIEGASEFAEGKAKSISGISIDGNQITIKLESSYSTFDLMLTQFAPLPKHILEGTDITLLSTEHEFFINNNCISSGPFMVEGMDQDYNLVFVKNPEYTDETTDIDKFIFCWDYENTELDYYATNNLNQMVSYRSMKGYEEHEVNVLYYRYFIFNTAGGDEGEDNTAMQDPRVRQAINHAIDVETLMNDVYLGKGTMVYGGAVDIATQMYEFNPEKAKQLLDEAGYDFNRTFTIAYYSGDTNSRIFLERIQKYLEDVGLKVELIFAGSAALYAEPTYDMMMKNLSSLNNQDWYNEYLSTNANISQLLGREGEFDDLVDQLNSVVDKTDYDQVLQELVDLEQELLYKMPMFLLTEAIYTNGNRLSVPEDIVFGNTRYFSDIRLDEWYVKKG